MAKRKNSIITIRCFSTESFKYFRIIVEKTDSKVFIVKLRDENHDDYTRSLAENELDCILNIEKLQEHFKNFGVKLDPKLLKIVIISKVILLQLKHDGYNNVVFARDREFYGYGLDFALNKLDYNYWEWDKKLSSKNKAWIWGPGIFPLDFDLNIFIEKLFKTNEK